MATTHKSTPTPMILQDGKAVVCVGFQDYGAFYNGALIGYRGTRFEAEELVNDHVYRLFLSGIHVPAGELAVELA